MLNHTIEKLLFEFSRLAINDRQVFLNEVNLYLVSSAQAQKKSAKAWAGSLRGQVARELAGVRSKRSGL
ncbi:hypothetical protein [Burkholderia ambifaria]|uniref:hypothetical protein n=1 Tax=Burkholderia ambifaria TaxID=152480 RepID=UPI00158D4102|nr:hypothetical protein [Burkholderia ambifaria]